MPELRDLFIMIESGRDTCLVIIFNADVGNGSNSHVLLLDWAMISSICLGAVRVKLENLARGEGSIGLIQVPEEMELACASRVCLIVFILSRKNSLNAWAVSASLLQSGKEIVEVGL